MLVKSTAVADEEASCPGSDVALPDASDDRRCPFLSRPVPAINRLICAFFLSTTSPSPTESSSSPAPRARSFVIPDKESIKCPNNLRLPSTADVVRSGGTVNGITGVSIALPVELLDAVLLTGTGA